MARPKPTTRSGWEQEGYEAMLDLVAERLVVPWGEVESRISHACWKDFHRVQPLQLGGARRKLRNEDPLRVLEETNETSPPVTTLRIPFPERRQREVERLRGTRRKLYRRYLSCVGDESLCGKHAERVVLASLQEAASSVGLYVPPQAVGRIDEVLGITLAHGPLDALAYILDTETIHMDVPLVVEVKNLRSWLHPCRGDGLSRGRRRVLRGCACG